MVDQRWQELYGQMQTLLPQTSFSFRKEEGENFAKLTLRVGDLGVSTVRDLFSGKPAEINVSGDNGFCQVVGPPDQVVQFVQARLAG